MTGYVNLKWRQIERRCRNKNWGTSVWASQNVNKKLCQSPRAVQGLRLVHWYNWTEDAMCSATYMRSGSLESYIFDSTSDSDSPSVSGYSLLEVILGAIVVLGVLIIVALMVVLVRGRRRYRVYRATMKRKRQNNNDNKSTNGVHKDQYSALNKV
ncbi:hypothetical protein EVAR_63263_1 [Eumeta japonica]|uniref:Uncharacterized protein n=1 Tax=Eumeta variegata TaxID=151549 RepID=A0A4C2A1E3_EUMVA|nr:hypothetical protein EVAR_63263_1 [Eumeta japonica]